MLTLEELASRKTVERKGGPPISPREVEQLLQILPEWSVANGEISKEYTFKSYSAGLNFAYAVGKIAEEKDHHPDILIGWRRVKLVLSTHSIGGLSENDFVMAASIEVLYSRSSRS